MLNTLKKVSNQFISDIYKIDILRFLIVYMRFLFLFYFLRKKRTFYSENQDVENIIKFKEKKKSYDKFDRVKIDETTLEHNLNYTKDIYKVPLVNFKS